MKGDVMTEEKAKQLIREARAAGGLSTHEKDCGVAFHEGPCQGLEAHESHNRNPIDSDMDYALRYGAAEASQEPRHCELHNCPEATSGCIICASQELFPAVSKTGVACLRDDWWDFRDWLEDETSGWDSLAVEQLAESMRKAPGDLLLRWTMETGPPVLSQAIKELHGAISEMLNIDVEPVRPMSHPRDYMAEALAICDERSNLTPRREHLLELRSKWMHAVQAARDLARGGK